MKMKKRAIAVAVNSVLSGLLVTACGGSESTSQGRFVDGPVAGLSYSTSAGKNGVTDANGAFSYVSGASADNVTFKVGALMLGAAAASDLLTPLDLVVGATVSDARVLNRLQLLQSLDSDKEVDNGIVIDTALAAKLNDTVRPVETDATKFEAALNTALGTTPVARGLARESFESS
ncbi:MAG: hypothetical protein K9J77_11535, partial [Rhodoferax sp.]|nr:hypothetical protein [Rhodoferax sp.]